MERVELVPMTREEFEAWLPEVIQGYAAEHVASGRWAKGEALEKSREEHARLLPQGVSTPNHHLWRIVRSDGHEPVGILWMAALQEPTPHAFVYYIEVDPDFRRHGYGEQAMTLLEDEARRLGLSTIRLHVFGHNKAARPLYEKLGYETTNVLMAKHLR